jgi:hypothetical protein
MNEAVRTKPQPDPLDQAMETLQKDLKVAMDLPPAGDELDRYMRHAERMLEIARQKQLALEAVYGRRRRELVNKLSDELHRLEAEHDAATDNLRSIIARLEAMR